MRASQEFPRELKEAKYGDRPGDKVTAWKDKYRIKPLMEAWDFKRSTTFDGKGSIKSSDQSVMHRVSSMMQGLNKQDNRGNQSFDRNWGQNQQSSNFGPVGEGYQSWGQGAEGYQDGPSFHESWGYNQESMQQSCQNWGNDVSGQWSGEYQNWDNDMSGQWSGEYQNNAYERQWENNGGDFGQDYQEGHGRGYQEEHQGFGFGRGGGRFKEGGGRRGFS